MEITTPYAFELTKTQIMGVLNITPDSFYEASRRTAPEAILARALEIEAEGADILDIGAQSTRPGHVPLPPQEELARLLPALEALRGRIRIPISVDTYDPETAQAALRHGARIINDVSGVVTEAMAALIKARGAGWILMHNGGGADAAPVYRPDVITAVGAALRGLARQAMAQGLAAGQLCLDPGLGFGKTMQDNYALLAATAKLKLPGMGYLVGASRKRMIDGCPPGERLPGTLAAHTAAQLFGATILRVHDVKEAVQARKVTERIQIVNCTAD
ncbi:MAG: dihydropteroate synthase [Oscillospiraceae bacterium]|jgi:dihydropteroate synthase|nr:dihydropteroate synthase [Oscillospiraceae bacterium]